MAAVCTVSGCGSTADVLDPTTREDWIEVRTLGRRDARWYCTTACAGTALTPTSGPAACNTTPVGEPMGEAGLLEVWDRGSARVAWAKVRVGAAESDSARVAVAAELEKLPLPLVALAANADLVRRLVGARWYVIMLAREDGASWDEIGEALRTTGEETRSAYAAAIERQERYVGPPLHDAARARAALADTGRETAAADCADGPVVFR